MPWGYTPSGYLAILRWHLKPLYWQGQPWRSQHGTPVAFFSEKSVIHFSRYSLPIESDTHPCKAQALCKPTQKSGRVFDCQGTCPAWLVFCACHLGHPYNTPNLALHFLIDYTRALFLVYKVGRIDVICILLGEVCMMQIFAIYRQKMKFLVCAGKFL